MNSSKEITQDKLVKENESLNDVDSKRLKVNVEFEDVEGFDPDAYHK